jgi:DNA-binding response OmpR family regulator
MIKFALWLITPDRDIAGKWSRLLSRERFNVKLLPDLAHISHIPQETWGLALAEICPGGLTSPQDLKPLLNGRKNVSIIVFSKPDKTSNSDISAYLENGADDFIHSDIDERVLLSKIKAHIRRILPNLNMARTVATSSDGEIEIERVKRTVRLGIASGKDKTLDGLTPKEFEIFFILLSNEDHVVSRKYLMEDVWREKSGDINCETIDKHVETLRRKLGGYGKRIKTVYGTGYIYKSLSKEPS